MRRSKCGEEDRVTVAMMQQCESGEAPGQPPDVGQSEEVRKGKAKSIASQPRRLDFLSQLDNGWITVV